MYLLPVRGGSVPIRRLPTANNSITKKKSQPLSIPGASLFKQDVTGDADASLSKPSQIFPCNMCVVTNMAGHMLHSYLSTEILWIEQHCHSHTVVQHKYAVITQGRRTPGLEGRVLDPTQLI